jgi:hypothetical protein
MEEERRVEGSSRVGGSKRVSSQREKIFQKIFSQKNLLKKLLKNHREKSEKIF